MICVTVLQFVLIRVDSNVIDLTLQVRAKVLLGLASAALVIVLGVLLVGPADLGIPGVVAALILGRAPLSVAYPVLTAGCCGYAGRCGHGRLAPVLASVACSRERWGSGPHRRPGWVLLVLPRVSDGGRRVGLAYAAGLTPQQRRRLRLPGAPDGDGRDPHPPRTAARGEAMMRLTYRLLLLLVASLPLGERLHDPRVRQRDQAPRSPHRRRLGSAGAERGGPRSPHTLHVVALVFVVWNACSLVWTIDGSATQTRVLTYAQLFVLLLVVWDSVTSATSSGRCCSPTWSAATWGR